MYKVIKEKGKRFIKDDFFHVDVQCYNAVTSFLSFSFPTSFPYANGSIFSYMFYISFMFHCLAVVLSHISYQHINY